MRVHRPERKTADLCTPLRAGPTAPRGRRDDKSIAQENLFSRPEESSAHGHSRVMKNASVQQPHSMEPLPFPMSSPSAADLSRRAVEGSAVPRTFRGNMESRSATNLSSRLPRRAVGPERSGVERSAVFSNSHVREEGR
jgi:hypothetical protein